MSNDCPICSIKWAVNPFFENDTDVVLPPPSDAAFANREKVVERYVRFSEVTPVRLNAVERSLGSRHSRRRCELPQGKKLIREPIA